MKVMIFGASGMVGQSVLRQALQADDVGEVAVVVRKPLPQQHAKLRQIIAADLSRAQAELAQLRAMEEQGLVRLTDGGIQVTATGWFFVRGVAMVFDKYLQADRTRARFSKIL